MHKVHQWKCSSSQRDRNRAKTGDRRTEQTLFVYQTDGQIAMAIEMVIGQLQKEMSTNVCTHYIKSPNRQKEKLDCSYGNWAHAFRQTEKLLSLCTSRKQRRLKSRASSTVWQRQTNVKYPLYWHSLLCAVMCAFQSRTFTKISVQSVFVQKLCEQVLSVSTVLYHTALW